MPVIKKVYYLQSPTSRKNLINSTKTALSIVKTIDAPLEIPFEFGGKSYTAHLIGDKYWLTRNLDYQVGDSTGFNGVSVINKEKFGQYYSLSTMLNNLKPIIPAPWRIATETDWLDMIKTVCAEQHIEQQQVAFVLADKEWLSNSTNAYNFNAVNNGGTRGSSQSSFFDYGGNGYSMYFNLQVDATNEVGNVQRRAYMSNGAGYGSYGYGTETGRWYPVRLVINLEDVIL